MRLVLLFLSVLVFSCSSSEKIPKNSFNKKEIDKLVFSFERTSCFGTCPEYKLSVYMSGKAELVGKANYSFIGTFDCQDCDQEMMAKVVTLADENKFWDMEKLYGEGVADWPSTITTLYMKKEPKSVTNILNGPEKLKDIESLIFDLYFKRVWVKKEK